VIGKLFALLFLLAAAAVRADSPPAFAPDSPVVNLTKENYEAEVLRSPIPVLVDYYEDWCLACRNAAPTLEWMARTWPGRLKVARIRIEQQPELDRAARISVVPTYFYISGGKAWQVEIERIKDDKGRDTVRLVPSYRRRSA
jgi:thioredoxin-like negative regulator of GroEL